MERLTGIVKQPGPLTLFLIGAIFFLAIWNLRWFHSTDRMSEVINSDGEGYYFYLPAIFIEGDLQPKTPDPDFHVKAENGEYINKYPYGTSLLMLPFFLLATICSWIWGYPIDGYSAFFQSAISLAALFYLLAGITFLMKTLKSYISFKWYQEIITITAIAFGTPLTYYVIYYPSLSHVYSFFLINLILWLFVRWIKEDQSLARTGFFLLLAIAVVTRPTHILILFFLPFFFNSFSEFKSFVRKLRLRSKDIFVFLFPVFIQLLLWKIQSDNWLMWSYDGEGFYFSHPHIFEFLFGFRKGFFTYAPIFFFIVPACFFGMKIHFFKSIITLLFLLITAYVFSSWYNWFYADLFAMRPMLDFAGAIIISGIVLLFHEGISGIKSKLILVFCWMSITLNLLFSYQFHHGVIHPNAMNAEKFFSVFMQIGKSYHHQLGGSQDLPPYAPLGMDTLAVWKEASTDPTFEPQSNPVSEFPAGKDFPVTLQWEQASKIWVYCRYKIKFPNGDSGKNYALIIQLKNKKEETKYYYPISLKEYITEEAGEFTERIVTLNIHNTAREGDIYSAYIWNKDKELILLRDVELLWLCPKKESLNRAYR